MLQQKIQNANERVHLQLASLSSGKSSPFEDPTDDPIAELSSSGRFLYDMIQQVKPRPSALHVSTF
jgi:hypothetical protein